MNRYSSLVRAVAATSLIAAAPAAGAQTTLQPSAPTLAVSAALRQAFGVPGQSSLLPLTYAGAAAPLTPGVARTAVDHQFGKGGGVTGSAGFLCGRGAGPDNNGAATAYGYDPEGRFVGAKLAIAFK